MFSKGLIFIVNKSWNCLLALYQTIPTLTTLKMKALENTVRKEENAGNQHFLLFPRCFTLSKGEILILVMTKLLSANAFNWVLSKILLFGKGLKKMPQSRSALLMKCWKGMNM